jgi:hypothetical protein
MFPNGSHRTDWDLDRHGNVVANAIKDFDVVALTSVGTVAVRLEAKPQTGEISRAAQATFTPQDALRLAEGLRRAAENMMEKHPGGNGPGRGAGPHIRRWA